MREYEVVYILDPALTDADVAASLTKYGEIIARHGGCIFRQYNLGKKNLAYPIKKQSRGHYISLDCCGENTLVADMERALKLDEKVLRYLTVKMNDLVDIETRKVQLVEEEAALAKAMEERAARKAAEEAAGISPSHARPNAEENHA